MKELIKNSMFFAIFIVSYSSCQSQNNVINTIKISDAKISNVDIDASIEDLESAFGAPDSILKTSSYGNPELLDFEIDESEIRYLYYYGDNFFIVSENHVHGFELNSERFSFTSLKVGDSSTKLEQHFSKSYVIRTDVEDGQLIKVQIETSKGNLSDDYILFIIKSGKIIRISSFKEI